MGILYERTEIEDKIIIRYKYLPIFYALLLIMVSSIVLLGPCISIIPFLIILFLWFDMREVNSEAKKAIEKDKSKVKVLGHKWSFSNPRIIEIPKELLKEEST